MRILIDSIDKRMTVPLIDDLVKRGYQVDGIGFNGGEALNPRPLDKIHYMNKLTIEEDLEELLLDYREEDLLLFGNPLMVSAVNQIKPLQKYLMPTDDSVNQANDKFDLADVAQKLSILYPLTSKENTVEIPYIIKLQCSENAALKPGQRYYMVHNQKDKDASIIFEKVHKGNLIYQQLVEGSGYGVSMLLDRDSRLVDYIVHKRLLEYPVSGGPSAMCQSVADQGKVEQSYELLKELKWQGFAMVEFKGDSLMEINPRFWGSMPLIFKTNSDFYQHYIEVCLGMSRTISARKVYYKTGVKMSYFPQGIISALTLIKRGHFGQGIKGLIQLMTSKEGIYSRQNPQPFFNYMKHLFKR